MPGASLNCTEVNTDGSQDNYFKGNHDVAPLNDWNFGSTWIIKTNDYPQLRWANDLEPATIINTCQDLQDIQADLYANYSLGQDIDCSETATWNDGAGFIPIGNDFYDGFSGVFDGQGHTISHIVSNSLFGVSGIFASTTGATIRNLNVSGGQFYGAQTAGTIVGFAVDTNFINIRANGTVSSDESGMSGTGGIAGVKIDEDTTTQNAYLAFSGNVSGTTDVGGLFGVIWQPSLESPTIITESYSTGMVSGQSTVGGLIGYTGGTGVENSYTTASVSGSSLVGGFIGSAEYSAFINSYASGLIQAGGDGAGSVGGFIGFSNNISIHNSIAIGQLYVYTDGVASGGVIGNVQPESGLDMSFVYFNDMNTNCAATNNSPFDIEGCYARYAYELPGLYYDNSGQAPLDQWDFDDVWLSRSNGLPQLQWSHPNIQISTCQDLQNMRNDLTADYTLAQDIDCKDTLNWNDGAGFEPLGDDLNQFTGTLNGAGHIISDLYINSSGYGGLFYKIQGGTVQNIEIDNASISGSPVAGTIAAYTYNASINDVAVRDTVVESTGEDITNSTTGGLVANLGGSGSINRSFFEGAVVGYQKVGGLIGWMAGGSVSIQDTYSRADVTGQNEVGGLIGRVQNGVIDSSYSIGVVTALGNENGSWSGGLIGYITSAGAALHNNFTNASVISFGETNSANALVGYSEDPDNVEWGLNVYNNHHADPEAGVYTCTTGPEGYYYSEGCYDPDLAEQDGYFFSQDSAPIENWDFDGVWHENYNDYPTLSPLRDAEILCQEPIRTDTTASIDCQVSPYGWGTTTWEMEYSEVGSDTTTPITLTDIHTAEATVSGLDPTKDYRIYLRFTNDWGTSDWGYQEFEHTQEATTNQPETNKTPETPSTPSTPLASIVLPAAITQAVTTGPTEISLNDFSDFTDGSGHQITLSVGQVIYFYIDGERHSATVKEIGADYVILTIASTPFDVRINVGQSKEVSVLQNGTKDLRIGLIRVENGQATLSFAQLKTPTTKSPAQQPINPAWYLFLLLIPIGFTLSRRSIKK